MRGVFTHLGSWLRILPILAFLLALPAAYSAPDSTNDAPKSIVFAAHDSDATQSYVPNPAIVRRLVDSGIQAMAGTNQLAAAWRRYVKPSDVVGFRIVSAPGPISGTRPVVVAALVESLIAAGHSPKQIVIWDKRASDLILAGYSKLAERLGVRWAATEEIGWDEARFYENATIGRLLIGDLEYPQRDKANVGRKSFVSRLLARDVTRIIPITPVLSHSQLGVNGQIANLSLGAVDNTMRFEQDAGRLAETLPEVCALDDIFPRLAFGVSDALICQYRGDERTYLHYAVALNQVRFSTDPVALDSLALDDIRRSRLANPTEGEKPFTTELYNNCALLDMGNADLTRIETRKVR